MMFEDDGGVAGKTYATFDPAYLGTGFSLSDNNLTATKNWNGTWNTTYLTVPKTSGKWAVEWEFVTGLISAYSLPGYANNRTLDTSLGDTPQATSAHITLGIQKVNGANSTGYWTAVSSPGSRLIMMMDFDNKKLAFPLSGVLRLSNAAITGPTFYTGIGHLVYADNIIKLNAGQQAFTAANEAMLAAYETANGVTINRGLWL